MCAREVNNVNSFMLSTLLLDSGTKGSVVIKQAVYVTWPICICLKRKTSRLLAVLWWLSCCIKRWLMYRTSGALDITMSWTSMTLGTRYFNRSNAHRSRFS